MGKLDNIKRYQHMLERKAGTAVKPYRADGYVNLLNKYGTAKDPNEHYFFAPEPIVPDEYLTILYEGNGLFTKIIDTPAEEAIKHGFKLKGVEDQEIIDFFMEALDELDFEEMFSEALKNMRLFGGAIIIMLINDGGGLEDPVDWKNIQSIDDMRVYGRYIIEPDFSSIYNYDYGDPFNKRGSRLGEPEYYHVFSKYGNFTVHESRCLVFRNGKLPENTTSSDYELWGIPEYVRIHRALKNVELAHNSSPKMLDKSVQPVYKMKNLMEELATEDGEDRVLKRLQLIDMARGMLNSIAIDGEGEEYDFKSFSYSGASELVDTTCNLLSAVTNIPQTILFGRAPAGMNATGESDMENWYSYIERIQKRCVKNNLRYLLSIIFQAGLYTDEVDEVPPIKIEFEPLHVMSEQEQAALEQTRAATQLTKAQVAQTYISLEILDPSEVRKALAESDEFDIENMLDELSEEELEEFMPKPGEEQDPMAAMMGAMGGGQAPEEKPEDAQGAEGSTAPNAPAATKLPQDMTEEDKENIQQRKMSEPVQTKNTQPKNAEELRSKVLNSKTHHGDGGPGSGIKGHRTPEDEVAKKNASYNVGNIDLTKRPKVTSDKMAAAGYDTEPGSISTVYSSYDFFWQGGEEDGKWVCVHYTPIMENGDVLSADDVYDYIASSGHSGNILDADKNGKHLVMNVEELPVGEADVDKFMQTGEASPELEEYMQKADKWGEDVHNAQAELYTNADEKQFDFRSDSATIKLDTHYYDGAPKGNKNAAGPHNMKNGKRGFAKLSKKEYASLRRKMTDNYHKKYANTGGKPILVLNGNNAYMVKSHDYDDFKVLSKFKIDGNQKKIAKIREMLKNE